MDNLIFSLNATLPIFFTMLLGLFFHKVGLMGDSFTSSLNSFVFKVALPVLLFQDLASSDFASAWKGKFVLFCFIATLISILLITGISFLCIKEKGKRGEFIQVSYRSSAAILGLAFIQNIYGDGNSSMASLMILGSVPLYNAAAVVILTLSQEGEAASSASLSSGKEKMELAKKTLWGILTNPIILGILAGLAWSLLRIPLPSLLSDTVHNLAVLATPLGLMAMGASIRFSEMKKDAGSALLATFIKLFGLSAIFLPFGALLGFRDQELVALLVMSGSASTVSCYIMAKNMGHDGILTSAAVMLTTFGCAFSLTFWLWLMKSLGLI